MRKIADAAESVPTFEPRIVLYGKDDAGKAHASAFGADDAELALKAAGLMRMFDRVVEKVDAYALKKARRVARLERQRQA